MERAIRTVGRGEAIFTKLRVADRAQAIVRAREAGLGGQVTDSGFGLQPQLRLLSQAEDAALQRRVDCGGAVVYAQLAVDVD